MQERVAVIGGGVAGLVATKIFKEDGFNVTGFETRPYIGGLWKDSHDSTLSVQSTTIFNSSKFRIAFTDFPFPESTDSYPTADQIFDYLGAYADHFDIRKHYCVDSKVEHILRDGDEWVLQIMDQTKKTSSRHRFDRVCVATGTFFSPRFPKLEGLDKFQGRVLHSIDFHEAASFQDQNVLLIGMHATAQDVTSVLSTHAKHVYLSHRSGLLMLPRFTDDGGTFDAVAKLPFVFVQVFLEKWFPAVWFWILNTVCKKSSLKAYGDLSARLNLDPAPSMAVSTPIMADVLVPFLKSGFGEPVSAVKCIKGPSEVELSDGRTIDDVDAIIYCTGYDTAVPENLIPKSKLPESMSNLPSITDSYDPYPDGPGSLPHLYMNTFPMTSSPRINNTLSFMGHAAVTFPGFIQQELQAQAISQIWLGHRHTLPAQPEMLEWHRQKQRAFELHGKKYNATSSGTYYPVLLPFSTYFPWVNRVAGTGLFETFGGMFNGLFNWRCWKLWWTDREMYDLCTKGILSPTIFRVFDVGGRKALEWEDAKKRLKRDGEVYERAKEAKRMELELEREREKQVAEGAGQERLKSE